MNRTRHIASFAAAFVFACALAWLGADTAGATTYCQYDSHCPSGSSCNGARCVLDSDDPHVPTDPGADEECGTDRRCRIRRLARMNRARRKMQVLREERALQALIERTERRRDEEITRQHKPWTLDLAASMEHEAGLMGGYSFTPHLKAEIGVYWPSQGVYASLPEFNIDGQHDYTLISVGPTYYVYDSTFSPYVRGAFLYTTGEFRPYVFGGGGTLATESHALSVGGGFDVQFDAGFHVRLGANYRTLLFTEASIQTGEYNDMAKKALEDDFYPVDLVFLIGWAF